ncbi:MAG: hypothetical protein OEV85_03315 [Candidatus Thorarchaeota archaeon]|nr:hypothetical protein [Candidatus Thorarchaeota archaeon]
MTDDDVAPLVYTIRSKIFTRRFNIWIVSIFVFTILAASTLSYAGFIQTDPLTAAVDGFLVAIFYVGFRLYKAYRVVRLHSTMKTE